MLLFMLVKDDMIYCFLMFFDILWQHLYIYARSSFNNCTVVFVLEHLTSHPDMKHTAQVHLKYETSPLQVTALSDLAPALEATQTSLFSSCFFKLGLWIILVKTGCLYINKNISTACNRTFS